MAEDLEEAAGPYVGLSDDINKTPGVRCNRIYRNSILCAFLIAVALCGKAIFRKPNDGERAEGPVDEYVISRGRVEGVSEKSVGVSFWTYPWTIAELSWQRTGFHFQTEANWMNDPNGPLVYKGWYHLFYQYNPVAAVWGNIAWGHAVSKDLVHWFYLDLAMIPDRWYDINGVWTGSATFLANETLVMLYTGSTNESVQVQNLAFPEDPSDPLLRKWVKSEANPILVPPKGVGPKDFRDPTTGWIGKDGIWRIAIGSKLGMTGVTLVFKTKDFIEYEQENILHSVNGTGMWECVDFFPVAVSGITGLDTSANGVGVKHVLKASFDDDKNDYYAIGTYDLEKQRFIPDDPAVDVGLGLRLDYGKYYASKSFYDPLKQRRILWGWVGETDSEQDDLRKGWASLQTVPRAVWFDDKTKANIIQWPIEEIDELRSVELVVENELLRPGSVVEVGATDGAQLDIELVFEFPDAAAIEAIEGDSVYSCSNGGGAAGRGRLGPFGLLVLAEKNLTEQTAVYFYVAKSADGQLQTFLCHDETRSSLASELILGIHGSSVPVLADEKSISVRTLVDHSIVESYAQGGRRCITSRVYPTRSLNGAAKLFLFNNATTAVKVQTLNVWHMDSVSMHPYQQLSR